MKFNYAKMQKLREKAGSGSSRGKLWRISEGEYHVYLHPSSRPDDTHPETDGLPFVEVCLHRNIGGANTVAICLNKENSPILTHPDIAKFVKKREKDPFSLKTVQDCPVCEAIENGDVPSHQADDMQPALQWLFGLTPIAYKEPSGRAKKLNFNPVVYMSRIKIFNGITDVLSSMEGIDPTDPNEAVLMIITRTGTGQFNTQYNVKVDPKSLINRVKLDKGQRKTLKEAIAPGGSCDLLRVVSNFIRSPMVLEALISGVEPAQEAEEKESDEKDCFGTEWADDDECNRCEDGDECRKASGKEKKQKAKTKSKSRKVEPEPEQEDDNDEDDEDVVVPEKTVKPKEPECFGEHDSDDKSCKRCSLAKNCKRVTATLDSDQAISENDDEDDEPEDDDEDSELAEMMQQAKKVANRRRRR